jgi:hypothetical protein
VQLRGTCLAGPDGSLATDCACADLDDDGDSDLHDFATFELNYGGN